MDKITIELDDADIIKLEYAANKDIVFNFVAKTLEEKDFKVIIKRKYSHHELETVASDLREEDLPF